MKVLTAMVLTVLACAASQKAVAQSSDDTVRDLCRGEIKKRAQHPSTVDIHEFIGYSHVIKADGTRLVKQTYSEKNDYGLELAYDAYCTLLPNGNFSMFVQERGR